MPEFKILPFVIVCCIFGLITLLSVLHSIESERRIGVMERKLQDLEQMFNKLQMSINSKSDASSLDALANTETDNNGSDETEMTFNNVNQLPQFLKSSHSRVKRAKGKKRKCKNCLPSVEFEGSGIGAQQHPSKNDTAGLWQPAPWVKESPTSKEFKYHSINTNGAVSVKKTGLYLVYAQMNLIGTQGGFRIEKLDGKEVKKKSSRMSKPSTLVTYKQTLHSGNTFDNNTGFTMRIVKLYRDDVILIRELDHNKGAYYDNETLFGMIQIGK